MGDKSHVLSLSYGKDSIACLGAIEELGWPLDRIIHAEVWATDTIPADLPSMMEFKAKHPYHLIKQAGGGSSVYGWVDAADVQTIGGAADGTPEAHKMRVGARVQYSGPLYRDSNGNGQGKTVNGTYTVKYYYPGRKCGVHIDGLGWVPESACKVIA